MLKFSYDMNRLINLKLAKYLRCFTRTILLIISVFWFVFALLSGSADYGGGLKGILMNSPNALPWLLLLFLVYIAFKWELVAGVLIGLMGGFLILLSLSKSAK